MTENVHSNDKKQYVLNFKKIYRYKTQKKEQRTVWIFLKKR